MNSHQVSEPTCPHCGGKRGFGVFTSEVNTTKAGYTWLLSEYYCENCKDLFYVVRFVLRGE